MAVPASEETLTQLAGLSQERAETALEAALTAHVLEETSPDRYAFRHVLARQAVYERILGPSRRRLHRQAIAALENQADAPVVQLAYHARQLGDPTIWIPRTKTAAEHAIAIGDDGIAAGQLQHLLSEASLPTDIRVWAALELSRIMKRRTEPAESIPLLRRIVADTSLPEAVRGKIRLNVGRVLMNHADPQGIRELEIAVTELEARRPEQAAVALATLGAGQFLSRTREQNLADMERARVLVERGDDPVARAGVLASRITLLGNLADPAVDELLQRFPTEEGNLEVAYQRCRALYNTADNYLVIGRDERAAALLDAAEDLAKRINYQFILVRCAVDRIELDFGEGRWDSLADRADHLAHQSTVPTVGVELMQIRAQLDIAAGRWGEAQHALSYCTGDAFSLTYLVGSAVLGRYHLARGDPAAAWNAVDPALKALRHKDIWVWQTDLLPVAAEAAGVTGHHREAADIVDRAASGARGADAPAATAEILLAQGLIAADTDPRAAFDLLEQARLRYSAIPRPYHAARCSEHLGHLLAADSAAAAPHFERALDAFTALDATADAARCQRSLRKAGQYRPAPRGRHSYGTDLTPRERQVADLLATGASNKDIAQALALSVRTAEHHVARVLKKLRTTRGNISGP
ncbi:hypothetical protein GCM10009838_79260 [Catenulispora subtropica]|uniref:HTH luxR-type domain-containing protein n=1 Tax=Catenulispora subtropica TaxID=450798 RepID=A0ABP5ELU5_9ACTN